MKFSLKKLVAVALFLIPFTATAGNLSQTVHFSTSSENLEVTPKLLFDAYTKAKSHAKITGFPVKIVSPEQEMKRRLSIGDVMHSFCFSEDMCGLRARVLDIQLGATAYDTHTIVLSWWNFGWLQALDNSDYTHPQQGSPDSILILTFKKTLGGAQIELSQVNVPDYKVKIVNPDGSEEIGPLSQIVNTHWNLLYWDRYKTYVNKLSKRKGKE